MPTRPRPWSGASGAVWLSDGAVVELGAMQMAVTHGHLKRVRRRLLDSEPDYLLVGHLHRKGQWREGRTRVLNPGALHRARPRTVALLDLATGKASFLEIGD